MKLVPLVKRSLSEEQVRRCVKAGRQDAVRLLREDHVNQMGILYGYQPHGCGPLGS